MPLALHLFIHLFLALLTGYLVGRHFKNIWLGITAGFLGGFLIDLDHVLEYFFIFGFHLNLYYFLTGRQFLKSDRIYIIFHAWEYIVPLLGLAWLFRQKKALKVFLLSLALASLVHLISDSLINNYPFKFYSIIYRSEQSFAAPRLLSPGQWTRNLELKASLGF